MQFFVLVLGLVVIIKSADILIDSSSKIAHRYGVSTFIIGITVIAFGTSAPELAVGIISGITRTNGLSLGNIIGSFMSNMALIVGVASVIIPLKIKESVLKRELPILFSVEITLGAMMFLDGRLSRIEGFALTALFILFMIYIVTDAKRKTATESIVEVNESGGEIEFDLEMRGTGKISQISKLWLSCILALSGLFLGGKITVESSTKIAESFGLSETLIGITVVAIATTMPELITSIIAARKKEHEIVLGNCIGSNIFNILLVLGVSSAITPIAVEGNLLFDFIVMISLTLFVFFVALFRKKIRRGVGIFLLAAYVSYLAVKVISAL